MAFAAVLVVGIGSVHLGEILLKQVLRHVGGWLTGRAGLALQGELADILGGRSGPSRDLPVEDQELDVHGVAVYEVRR